MKNNNKTKKLSIILGLAVLAAVLGLTAALSGMKKPPEKKIKTYQPPAVPTLTVELKNIQSRIPIIGSLTAKNKIEIFTEVIGILLNSQKPLLEGIHFKKGEPLLKLNSKEPEQILKIYVTVSGPNLKEYMYLKGNILGQSFSNDTEIPRRLLQNDNQIMIVKNNTIELLPIKILQLHLEPLIAQNLPQNTILPLKTEGLHQGLKVRVTDAKTL
jgi:hypothetical protein